jgi:hypothetical protein
VEDLKSFYFDDLLTKKDEKLSTNIAKALETHFKALRKIDFLIEFGQIDKQQSDTKFNFIST